MSLHQCLIISCFLVVSFHDGPWFFINCIQCLFGFSCSQCLVKPPVKESTIPLDLALNSDIRAVERAEFDHQARFCFLMICPSNFNLLYKEVELIFSHSHLDEFFIVLNWIEQTFRVHINLYKPKNTRKTKMKPG